jgi:protein-S-isoprenylcysteine O-methyltransferase Ste14
MAERSSLNRDGRRRIRQIRVTVRVMALAMLLPAGRPDWWNVWVYLGLYVGSIAVRGAWTVRHHPVVVNERGHRVATGGPYRLARQPMYAVLVCFSWTKALLLASLWALPVAAAGVILLVIRTALEDAVLRAELPGYSEYAESVRSRLVPGVWWARTGHVDRWRCGSSRLAAPQLGCTGSRPGRRKWRAPSFPQ